MKEIIETADRYEQLESTGSLKLELPPVSRPKKGCGEVEIKAGNFTHGCGISAGDVRRVRWWDDTPGRKARARGSIVVAALSVAYCENDEMWEVTFVKRIETAPTYYMARVTGYTTNPELSIDLECPVLYTPDVEDLARVTDARPRREKPQPTEAELRAEEESTKERAELKDAILDQLTA